MGTAETSRAINSEISSRKLEEVKMDLNAHAPESINSTIQEIVLPTIQNDIKSHNSNSREDLDLRSDGPHKSKIDRMAQKCDLRSDRLHLRKNGELSRERRVDFPKVNSTKSNRNNRLRESSVDDYENDKGYD